MTRSGVGPWRKSRAELPALQERARQRCRLVGERGLLARVWQALSAGGGDAMLATELHAAAVRRPADAALHNALGLAMTLHGGGGGPITESLAQLVAGHFHRALRCDASHAVAALNLAEALVGMRQPQAAADVARAALATLGDGERFCAAALDAGHFPPAYDVFRVEWEHAAWDHPGDPAGETHAKRALLRWRLHCLLAELTGKTHHFYEAVLARPDLPTSRAALGSALGREGLPAEAAAHLRPAAHANPFDREACRNLTQALRDAGDERGARRSERDRRHLLEAAPGLVEPEPWFLEGAPVGDELASLIVLCCNEGAVTRLCLESVLRHTRPPYELVLVDNGSSDATPSYLEEIRRRPGPARVEVIRNEQNIGFARGCNQGLAAARGRYVVFLNNDTVVTPNWLDGLTAWATHDWPRVGMVGAVTNYAAAPQQVDGAYSDLAGLDEFALRRAREFRGKALEHPRLTGFCLLARREVLDKVGSFDERYGLGFFEDDDLCVRVREAGFRLLVALDVFIHHFGSRTFQSLGVDTESQLRANFEQFKAKWGPHRGADYRLPAGGAANLVDRQEPRPAVLFPASPGTKTTLCLIVKNEEKNLPECLRCVADLFDEVIVTDTGSTDRTREIAASFGPRVKVVDFAWCDDFAAARNAGLEHATGAWIFWMDADDRLDEENREKLRALLAGLGDDNAAYAMKCRCLPDPVSQTTTVVDHVRLFRRHPRIRWQYRVHEQILPAGAPSCRRPESPVGAVAEADAQRGSLRGQGARGRRGSFRQMNSSGVHLV